MNRTMVISQRSDHLSDQNEFFSLLILDIFHFNYSRYFIFSHNFQYWSVILFFLVTSVISFDSSLKRKKDALLSSYLHIIIDGI